MYGNLLGEGGGFGKGHALTLAPGEECGFERQEHLRGCCNVPGEVCRDSDEAPS